jgi:hypothetical protein
LPKIYSNNSFSSTFEGLVMGSKLGVEKVAAKRVGLTLEEYREKVKSGLRWCCGCKEWHELSRFSTDNSRDGGLAKTCRAWRNRNLSRAIEPIDKRRARRLVQMRVRRGTMPHPSSLPCSRCGTMPEESGKRHEYHHHKGYSLEYRADVVCLCSTCHSQEED